MRENRLKKLWAEDKPALGGWMVLPSNISAEYLAHAGFDWLCVDTQHGLVGFTELREIVQAVRFMDVPELVLVSPDLAAAVAACRYPPDGTRSWGPTGASIGRRPYTTEGANRETACFAMIETRQGLDDVDEIAAVPGLDGIYVGPNDLGLSLGLPPMLSDHGPVLTDAIVQIGEACRRHGIVPGVAIYEPDAAAAVAKWQGHGFTLFGLPSDGYLLRRAADALLASLPPRS